MPILPKEVKKAQISKIATKGRKDQNFQNIPKTPK